MSVSSAAAYRNDRVGKSTEFGLSDGTWLTVGSVLSHAKDASRTDRRRLIGAASRLARAAIGLPEIRSRAKREKQPVTGPLQAVSFLAEDAENAGALKTAGFILDAAMAADASIDAVNRGRLLARRARVDAKLGNLNEAMSTFRMLEQLARRENRAELRVRAWIGQMSIAQMRGNYPEMARLATRSLRLARSAKLPHLARIGHSGLMITAGIAGRWGDALLHGWSVYKLSIGNERDEVETLQNVGQLLLDAGHPVEARAVFRLRRDSRITRQLLAARPRWLGHRKRPDRE